MNVAKFSFGLALMILNIAISMGIPNAISSYATSMIEMVQLFFLILSVVSVIAGVVER